MALSSTTMLLIPKGGVGYRGIGIVEVIWKVCALIVNNILRSAITLHSSLHGFRQGRGAATTTMEEKLAKKLAGIVHGPLFQVFINVRKYYDSLDIGICTEILRGCVIGSHLYILLQQ